MKKLIIIAVALVLAGCASTQLRIVDGKEQQVMVSMLGTYAPAKHPDDFKKDETKCFREAVSAVDGKYPDASIPFNYSAREAKRKELYAVGIKCLENNGHKLIEKAPQ